MKRIVYLSIIASAFLFSCTKEEDVTEPVSEFTVLALDSVKASALSAGALDIAIKNGVNEYFVEVPENISFKAYKRIIVVRFNGVSTFRSIYPGDPTHILVDPAKPGSITAAQSGFAFPNDYYVYTYTAAGTYPVSVVASTVSQTAKVLRTATKTKTIILQ